MHYYETSIDHRSATLLRHKYRVGFKRRKGKYSHYWIRRLPAIKLVVVPCEQHGFTPICHMRGSRPLLGSCVVTMDEAMDYLFVTASANVPDLLDLLRREAA